MSLLLLLSLLPAGCGPFAPPQPTAALAPTETFQSSPPATQPAPPPSTPIPTQTLTPSPAATVTPSPTPTPTPCLDSLGIVLRQGLAESTLDALQELPAGTPGNAAWRVRNTGTCTWDSSYALVSLDNGSPQFLQRTVNPGDLLDLNVGFTAPSPPGPHILFWELRNGRGQAVGDPLVVNLLSADLPVPTLPPGVTLRAYPETIQPEERTTISWNVQDAREVYFFQPGQSWQSHPTKPTGNFIDYPTHTTSYELRVVRGDNSVEIYRVRVEVEPFDPPKIVYFRPERQKKATPDGCVVLEWNIHGRIQELSITRNGSPLFNGVHGPAFGSVRDCDVGVNPVVYVLTVIGPGGQDQATCTYCP